MQTFLKKYGPAIIAIVVVIATFGIGMYVGSSRAIAKGDTPTEILNGNQGKAENVDFAPFWKAWQILDEKYVATHGTSSKVMTNEDKVYGAIQGLAKSYGDPYTVFFPPEESKQFESEISGSFEGVGMEVGIKDNIITVIAPLKGTPAEKAGIRAGDRILSIDGKTTQDMTVEEAVKMIRGKQGTTVKFSILPKEATTPKEISVVRSVIDVPTIKTELRKDGIFVISLYTFNQNSQNLFRDALQKFVDSKSNKLVLDLRGNPGGYLDSAVDMASWFLPKDKIVVKEDSGGHGDDRVYKSLGYNIFNNNLKMVILVDGGSASASEILAGALSEHGIAKLVGTKTFGKGSVQELVPLTDGTSLKITVARWLTPNGHSISEQGLKPDVEVKFTPEQFEKGQDPQMDKAVELLK
jgi:carboxyl-terminal processing protease